MSVNNNLTIVDFSGKNLNEVDVQERIEELRKLVLEDNKLKNFRTDDAYLLRYLHTTKFDVPAAFKRMQSFCDLMLEHPKWFARYPPLERRKKIEQNDKIIFRERDRAGRAIVLQKLGKIDAANTNPAEQAEIFETMLELVMDDPKVQAAGLCAIVDMDGYSWKMFKWLTPSNIKVGSRKMDVYPFGDLMLHVVNTSFLLNASIKLVWPFLSENIKNTFKFHYDNWNALHEYINPDILPSEYGGTGPDIDFDKANQYLFDKNAEIQEKLKHRKVLQN